MSLAGLVDHLIDAGPYNQLPYLDTEDETLTPPVIEDTKEEKSVGKNELMDGEEELGEEHIEEGNSKKEPLDEDDPKEDPMEEKDLEEDHEGRPLGEDDPEEDLWKRKMLKKNQMKSR